MVTYEVNVIKKEEEMEYKVNIQTKAISSDDKNKLIQELQKLPNISFIKLKS